MLKAVLPRQPRVAFRNPKTLSEKLVRSKLTSTDDNERGNFPCGRGNCQICNVLKPSKEFKSIVTGKTDKMNLHFDSNSLSAVCLISCKMCKNSKLGQQIQNSEHRLINLSQT